MMRMFDISFSIEAGGYNCVPIYMYCNTVFVQIQIRADNNTLGAHISDRSLEGKLREVL